MGIRIYTKDQIFQELPEKQSTNKIQSLPQQQSKILSITKPKTEDVIFDLIYSSILKYEKKNRKTPSLNELWTTIISDSSSEFGTSFKKTTKELEITGENSLTKEKLRKRYNKYYNLTVN
ncbi:MAG: hypothetical protein KZQ83_12510 [gamma proteobacterium symbiont of Taylorina sp.]|nr:hypothetical protein [gamma proteobacterium symbiont of Taylorina sp.]